MKKWMLTVVMGALAVCGFAGPAWGVEAMAIELERDGLTLKGELRHPDGATELLIVHAGSGPTDRDGNQGPMQNDSLKLVAEGLANSGVAVLSFDKRASGETGMSGPESDLRPATYINDLAAWVTWAAMRYPDMSIHLLGHSEGALFALAVGQQAEIASVISLAGAGRPAGALLREQTEGRLGPLVQEFENTLGQLEAGTRVETVNPMLAALFRPAIQPYLIEWLAMDPAALAASLPVPLLVISGSSDLQVVEADYRALEPHADTAVWIDGMNHILKAVGGALPEQMASYNDPELPLHPELMPVLIAWFQN